MKKKNQVKHRRVDPSEIIEQQVVKLKEALDGGALFSKSDIEYIVAAYDQVQNKVKLSPVQAWVVSQITPIRSK